MRSRNRDIYGILAKRAKCPRPFLKESVFYLFYGRMPISVWKILAHARLAWALYQSDKEPGL